MKRLLMLMIALFAFRSQGLWAQGHLGFVGVGKEATFGTGVAATDYFEIMSESLTTERNRFPVRNAFAGFNEPDDYPGTMVPKGDLVMFGHPVSIGHLLKAVFNTISQATVLSGFLYRNNFSTTKSEFAYGVPVQPYTYEVHRDTGSSFRYLGVLCDRLNLNISPNQDLRVTAALMAQGQALIARSTPTFPGSPTFPFAFDTASLSIAGGATARIEALNIEIRNSLADTYALNASNIPARYFRRDVQMARISGVLDLPDVSEYLDFINASSTSGEKRWLLTLSAPNSFQLTVDMPRVIYERFPTGIRGRDRQTVAFSAIARTHPGSAVAIDIGLTTVKSNY